MKKDIKIIGVISSARYNGNTAALVREALKGAAEEGALVKEIFLPEYKLKPCIGCLNCTAEGRCPIPDEFESIRKLVYEADGIILGSPTYAMEQNSIMKCFLERLGVYTLYASLLGGKYCVGISTSNTKNASKKVAKGLTSAFKMGLFERSYVSGYLGVQSSYKGVEKKICESPDDLNKARKLGRKIAEDIKSNNKYSFQNLIMRLIIALHLKPVFTKYILKNKDGKERATYRSLYQRGLI